MKTLPFVSYASLQTHIFWLLGIAGCLIAIHLDITLKTSENFDLVVFRALIWFLALSMVWKKHKSLTLETGTFSLFFGLTLIAWSCFRSIVSRSNADILVDSVSPFVSALGLCLLASGFKGLKQYWQELTVVAVSILPTEFILTLIDKIMGVNVTVLISILAAKVSAFVLWYLGFEVHRQENSLILPGGSVLIGGSCSGINAMILLLQIALIVIVIFPTIKLYKKLFLPFVAVLVAFLVNCFRVGLMAFLVAFSNHEAFVFWHEGAGSQIFSTISILLFCWFCQFMVEQDEPELSIEVKLEES